MRLVRRPALLLLSVVLVFGAIGVYVGTRPKPDSLRENARAVAPALMLATCRFAGLVSEKKFAEAHNLFWDDVHTDAHVVAAALGDIDRKKEAGFLRAKGAVERDLGTLSVGLAKDSPAFVDQVRAAQQSLGVPETRC
jgi:hypothetical protein